MKKIMSDPKQLNMFVRFVKRIKYIPTLLTDKNVSIWNKFMVGGLLAYVVSPVDLISEIVVPGVGIMDDAMLTLIILNFVSGKLDAYIQGELDRRLVQMNKIKVDKTKIVENVDYEVKDD